MTLLASATIGLFAWWCLYGFESYLNGGDVGRNRFLFPFQCFWGEVLWNLPGGHAAFAKKAVGRSNGIILGHRRSWHYAEVREKDLYEACGRDILPGLWHLLFMTIFPFAVGFVSFLFISRL